jgi:hypothetical protein
VSTQDLAVTLKLKYQNITFPGIAPGHVEVRVFDNTDAPKQVVANWSKLTNMSDQEFNTFWDAIEPHEIAHYWKNVTTGLEDVEVLDRTASANVVQIIKLQ